MGRTFFTNRKRIDKLSNDEKLDLMLDLIYSFGIVRNPRETAIFLQDLLTSTEIRNLSFRLRIAKLLLAGLTFEEITSKIHVSSATITKVSIWLEQGGGGFKNVISKLPLKWEKPGKLPHGPLEFHLPDLLLALTQHKLSEKNIGLARIFSKGADEKGVSDRSLREANKFLYLEKRKKTSEYLRNKF